MPPVAAAIIPAVIGAGATMVAANQARHQSQPLIDAQKSMLGTEQATAQQLQPYVKGFYSRAQAAYDPALSHYLALASGDHNTLMQAVAPDLANNAAQYRSVINATRQLTPRSGASAAYGTDLAFRAADANQGTINAARANAYPALTQMAALGGQLGSGAAGGATLAAGTGTSIGNSTLQNQSALNAQQAAAYTNIGNQLGTFLTNYKSGNGKPSSPSLSSNDVFANQPINYLTPGSVS